MRAEEYRQIIVACFPELAINSCAIHSAGWDSVAVVVNDELIFRFPKRSDVEPQYQIERQLLPALAAKLRIGNVELGKPTQFSICNSHFAIPDIAFFWPGGAAFSSSFIGHHLISGVPLAPEHLTPNYIDSIAQQLGEFLSALHSFPIEQANQLGVPAGDPASWHQRYRDRFKQVQSRALPLLDHVAQARIVRDWGAFLNDQAHFSATLIHHDLSDQHILFNAAHGTLSGIIDWGDTTTGDPAIDFAGLLAAYGEDFTRRVLAHYQGAVDPAFRQRMRFYRGVMPLNTLLFGLDTRQEEYVRQGLSELNS